jgi:hypothetical protein
MTYAERSFDDDEVVLDAREPLFDTLMQWIAKKSTARAARNNKRKQDKAAERNVKSQRFSQDIATASGGPSSSLPPGGGAMGAAAVGSGVSSDGASMDAGY